MNKKQYLDEEYKKGRRTFNEEIFPSQKNCLRHIEAKTFAQRHKAGCIYIISSRQYEFFAGAKSVVNGEILI